MFHRFKLAKDHATFQIGMKINIDKLFTDKKIIISVIKPLPCKIPTTRTRLASAFSLAFSILEIVENI